MSGSKFLPILIILVSGFIICASLPRCKKAAVKSNGQQLTLISAIAGLTLFIPTYLLLLLFITTGDKAANDDSIAPTAESLLSTASITAFVLSIIIFVIDRFARKYYSFMLDDSRLKKKISKTSQKYLNEALYQTLYSIAQHLHWYSYIYFIYSARCIYGQDQAENLYLNSMLEQQSGLCMFVMESRKVVIGNVTGMPDPKEKKAESCVRILPYFTGHLCENHLQLHITTDYTKYIEEQRKGDGHQHYNFDVILSSNRITYVREFDRDFFNEQFIWKKCPCGHKLYNTTSLPDSKPNERLKGFRNNKS